MLGITEIKTGLANALRRVGKQDEGETVGIAYFDRAPLSMVPLVLRAAGFLLVLSLYFVQRPLAWLDFAPGLGRWSDAQLISPVQYGLAVLIYALYFAATLLQAGFYKGQPGVELHFTKHQRIVRTLKPGESARIVDPRVRPYAAVSTKPFVLDMPSVKGATGDNISLSYKGALIAQVGDTYRLLERGGFEPFCKQLQELFESVLKDEMLGASARDFNRFLVERAGVPKGDEGSITDRLGALERSDLSVSLLSKIASIAELDVSRFDLAEAPAPRRRALLGRLQGLAEGYGIVLLDHLPQGNLTSDEYLRTLAVGLVSSITRVRQATETLKDITEEEIGEEIAAKVADVSLGVLEVERIISEIDAIKTTLEDKRTQDGIIGAREAAIRNITASYLAPALSQVSTLKEQVRARGVRSAALEAYVGKQNELLARLEEAASSLPRVSRVVTDEAQVSALAFKGDLVETLLEKSGLREVLGDLKARGEREAEGSATLEDYQLDVPTLMAELARELDKVPMGSGAEVKYTPERVRKQVDAIARSVTEDVGGDVDRNVGGALEPGRERLERERPGLEEVELEGAALEKLEREVDA